VRALSTNQRCGTTLRRTLFHRKNSSRFQKEPGASRQEEDRLGWATTIQRSKSAEATKDHREGSTGHWGCKRWPRAKPWGNKQGGGERRSQKTFLKRRRYKTMPPLGLQMGHIKDSAGRRQERKSKLPEAGHKLLTRNENVSQQEKKKGGEIRGNKKAQASPHKPAKVQNRCREASAISQKQTGGKRDKLHYPRCESRGKEKDGRCWTEGGDSGLGENRRHTNWRAEIEYQAGAIMKRGTLTVHDPTITERHGQKEGQHTSRRVYEERETLEAVTAE